MSAFGISPTEAAIFVNVGVSSVVIILAFSLLAYTLIYNFRNSAAQAFALFLGCIVVAYSGDVALNRVLSEDAANVWIRVQWLGIAMLPWAYYIFSQSVLQQTNTTVPWGRNIGRIMLLLSLLSVLSGLFGNQLLGELTFRPPLSYLESGPFFWLFALFFGAALLLSLANIIKARKRCLTENSRKRMTYLLLGFVAPGIGVFPYLMVVGQLTGSPQSNALVFFLALLANVLVGIFLVFMSYTVAYFGVLTPDRVVRYRMLRFFTRGPIVAILVIFAIQTLPRIERVLGLPRDIILFSVITGVIICSQLILSVTKTLVDRLVYREDFDEAVWLRELDRRLLTTSDLRQFLENNLTALCELLQSPSGFVAAVVGPDLILEATVGDHGAHDQIIQVDNWSDALSAAQQQSLGTLNGLVEPTYHAGFWVWPLMQPNHNSENGSTTSSGEPSANGSATSSSKGLPLGILGVLINESATLRRTEHINGMSNLIPNGKVVKAMFSELSNQRPAQAENGASKEVEKSSKPFPHFTEVEKMALERMIERTGRVLMDRQLQQEVFGALRRIIPEIDEIQQLRNTDAYVEKVVDGKSTSTLLDPSPIHSPEFSAWVRDALSHYWGGPKLTRSPLTSLRVVSQSLDKADGDPTKALRLVLGSAIERMKPNGEERNTPEWLLYNILAMRYIEGKKVREAANRLAMSESDLYRKQRVAIDQVARLLSEMEQDRD